METFGAVLMTIGLGGLALSVLYTLVDMVRCRAWGAAGFLLSAILLVSGLIIARLST